MSFAVRILVVSTMWVTLLILFHAKSYDNFKDWLRECSWNNSLFKMFEQIFALFKVWLLILVDNYHICFGIIAVLIRVLQHNRRRIRRRRR